MIVTGTCCISGFKQRFAFNKSFFQMSLFLLSYSPILSGLSAYRLSNSNRITYDTAWLFVVTRQSFLSNGGFDPLSSPNEDYDFNKRIVTSSNLPIYLNVDSPLYYFPRNNLSSFFFQYFRYGFSKSMTFKKLSISPLNKKSPSFVILVGLFALLIAIISLTLSVSLYIFCWVLSIGFSLFLLCRDPLAYSRVFPPDSPLRSYTCALLFSFFLMPIPLLAYSMGSIFSLFK